MRDRAKKESERDRERDREKREVGGKPDGHVTFLAQFLYFVASLGEGGL